MRRADRPLFAVLKNGAHFASGNCVVTTADVFLWAYYPVEKLWRMDAHVVINWGWRAHYTKSFRLKRSLTANTLYEIKFIHASRVLSVNRRYFASHVGDKRSRVSKLAFSHATSKLKRPASV